MQPLTLHEAKERDIPVITELAHVIWQQHYPDIISQEQIDYMLMMMYSAESLKEQMQQKLHRFFLIHLGDDCIGFMSLHEVDQHEWFLNKFYIKREKSAKGIGSEALQQIIQKLGAKKMRLTVNRQNFKSINFYFKNGFVIERVADFDIGNGYVMNDFVMLWTAV